MPNTNKTIINQLLSENGDGTGDTNMTGAYLAPTIFKVTPPVGEVYEINNLIVHIHSPADLTANGYGSLTELANGIVLKIVEEDWEKQLNPINIKSIVTGKQSNY